MFWCRQGCAAGALSWWPSGCILVHGCQHGLYAGMAGATMLGDVAGFLGRLAICLLAHAQRLGLFSRQAQVKGNAVVQHYALQKHAYCAVHVQPQSGQNVIGAMEQFVVNGCTNNAHLMLSLVNSCSILSSVPVLQCGL